MSDNYERSRPHRRVENILNDMGVSFMSEVAYFPPYKLDIFLPKYHLCIEVDGPYHLRKHDKTRDEWMRQRYGIETMRIKAKGKWLSQGKLEKDIKDFIVEWQNDIEERKAIWRQIML